LAMTSKCKLTSVKEASALNATAVPSVLPTVGWKARGLHQKVHGKPPFEKNRVNCDQEPRTAIQVSTKTATKVATKAHGTAEREGALP
jgi:hypothetical protein